MTDAVEPFGARINYRIVAAVSITLLLSAAATFPNLVTAGGDDRVVLFTGKAVVLACLGTLVRCGVAGATGLRSKPAPGARSRAPLFWLIFVLASPVVAFAAAEAFVRWGPDPYHHRRAR